MSRADTIDQALQRFDSGELFAELARRVAYPTERHLQHGRPHLRAYLTDELTPALAELGCTTRVVENTVAAECPLLVATRHEADDRPTVLLYGHGDVVNGEAPRWRTGLDPWTLTAEGERWYGRGSADNKGQHTVNLFALREVLRARGQLGFNLAVLIETGEERGSPGLVEACAQLRDELRADVLIASDGPRVRADRPTLYLGSRGVTQFTLTVDVRPRDHHSGNWGGVLRNAATTLSAAITSLVDGQGRILVPGLRPPAIPDSVRAALKAVPVGGGADDPVVDEDWGEPGLTPAERLFGWNTVEVLAFLAGNPASPVNAIPGHAQATLQLRSVVGTDLAGLAAAVRNHLVEHGFDLIEVAVTESRPPTRTDPDHPWVRWAVESVGRTTGAAPVLLPNLGGTIPNDAFAEVLGVPTIWLPHSYPACAQHAPDEHVLAPLTREAVAIMTGLYWDLGEKS
ncbi:M20 family metallopeptidase [Amycolatopsis sp. FDAARGOS 1241]|uniref:M20 family metallopeptidase n=1 Tax=Amycolatopsis sp. FDAARGOS 1241 TaxID=2778070 RepID=UPI0019520F9A|nr:M20 family metallopeptidase [Amycolatopsis sp. FDAARGOS 1241]QRP49771.1 M20 family metallopeptidase [Amycolatopsis sp. FDAARGOS 1241]